MTMMLMMLMTMMTMSSTVGNKSVSCPATPPPKPRSCHHYTNHYNITFMLVFLIITFLATLVALHFTPVSEKVSEWAEFRTSVAWSLRACLTWLDDDVAEVWYDQKETPAGLPAVSTVLNYSHLEEIFFPFIWVLPITSTKISRKNCDDPSQTKQSKAGLDCLQVQPMHSYTCLKDRMWKPSQNCKRRFAQSATVRLDWREIPLLTVW